MTRHRYIRQAWQWGCGHVGDPEVWPKGGESWQSCPDCAREIRRLVAGQAEISIPVVAEERVLRFRLPKWRRP